MTTKNATKIAMKLTARMNDTTLAAEVAGLNLKSNEADQVINSYRQIEWDKIDDLVGDPAPKAEAKAKAAPKAKAKAAKKATPKAKAKAAPKTKAKADKRVGKDGQVIVAYPKPQGRTRVMFALVLAGASNADGLAHIKKEFKGAPTTISSIGWVRSQLRNNAERWNGKYGSTSKLIKGVKADKDCGKLNVKELNAILASQEDDEQ